MSTKTTLKRIALVAVSSMSFGLLTSVAPANAVNTEGSISVTQLTTARVGAPVLFRVSMPFTSDGAADVAFKAGLLTAAPGTSAKDGDDWIWHDNVATNLFTQPTVILATGGPNVFDADGDVTVDNAADGTNLNTFTMVETPTVLTNGSSYVLTAYASFIPDAAGAWNFSIWSDSTANDTLDVAEKVTTVSVAAVDTAIKSISVTSLGAAPSTASTTAEADTELGLMKVTLTGSDDLPALPTAGEFLTATVSNGAMSLRDVNANTGGGFLNQYLATPAGSVLATGAVGVTSLNLRYFHFDETGSTYIRVSSAAEETASLTVTVAGTAISGTANQSFITSSGTSSAVGMQAATTVAGVKESAAGADPDFIVPAGTKTATYYFDSATASSKIALDIVDTAGLITGLPGVQYSRSIAVGSTAFADSTARDAVGAAATANFGGSFSVTTASGSMTLATTAYSLEIEGTTDVQPVTIAAPVGAAGAIRSNGATNAFTRAAAGSAVSVTFRCTDDFGSVMGGKVVTPVLAGRNAALVVLPTLITNSSGLATLTYTDVSTSTTSLTDTITFTAAAPDAACTAAATVTFSSATGTGVSTVTWTSGGAWADTDTGGYAGLTLTNIEADDNASAGSASLVFTVKDSAGIVLAGVPVTFTVDSGYVRKTSTIDYATVLTGATGTATVQIFATKPGKQTVTATAGGKTATGYVTWVQAEANDARSISAAVSGNKITFTIKDRFGNGINNAGFTATTNVGYFGNGGTSSVLATDVNGEAVVYLSGNDSEATVSATLLRGTYPQAYDVAGAINGTAATALTAGTTTGFGASDTAAGVATASVKVAAVGPTAAQVAADAAADAAAEAIDAANAATDAANLAAEAADAATVAAEEARDAADAATAAVEDLATQVATLMAALKAQITTLANTVAKIAKKVKA